MNYIDFIFRTSNFSVSTFDYLYYHFKFTTYYNVPMIKLSGCTASHTDSTNLTNFMTVNVFQRY